MNISDIESLERLKEGYHEAKEKPKKERRPISRAKMIEEEPNEKRHIKIPKEKNCWEPEQSALEGLKQQLEEQQTPVNQESLVDWDLERALHREQKERLQPCIAHNAYASALVEEKAKTDMLSSIRDYITANYNIADDELWRMSEIVRRLTLMSIHILMADFQVEKKSGKFMDLFFHPLELQVTLLEQEPKNRKQTNE